AQPVYNSMLRTTGVATMLEGGHAPNALPQLARANVNCRVLPDHDVKDVQATLVKLAGDTAVHVSPAPEPRGCPASPLPPERGAPASPLTPEVLGPIERLTKEMWPGIPVVPVMGTGATDGRALRQKNIPTNRVSGLFDHADGPAPHGPEEPGPVKT